MIQDALSLSESAKELLAKLPDIDWETGRIPQIEGLPPFALAQWLYLQATQSPQTEWPLVCVDQRAEDPEGGIQTDCLDQAANGWLALGPGLSQKSRRRLKQGALRRNTWVLSLSRKVHAVEGAVLQRLRGGLRFFHVASDPGLAKLRAALAAHGQAGNAVHLTGEPGVGKGALAAWAHAAHGQGDLVSLSDGLGAALAPSNWLLVRELFDLAPEHRALLERRVEGLSSGQSTPMWDAPPRPTHSAFRGIWGRSPRLCVTLGQAERAAQTPHSVLVLGESGTGKELLAKAIHHASGRQGPFVAIDLAAIAPELLESELFGHIKGAFTGADHARKGAFRSAEGGTLFLDELGNIPISVQTRLLRVLQERQVRPVGSDELVGVDVRVVAATNAELDADVAAGRFREDLAMRLNTFVLKLPPLRERVDDIPYLATKFLEQESGLPRPEGGWLTPEARGALKQWWWPGNIRELRSSVLRASTHHPGQPLSALSLGLTPGGARPGPVLSTSSGPVPAQSTLSRACLHRLTALSLRVPAIRDRSAEARRSLVLHRLAGRTITNTALARLAQYPWWGNFTELDQALRALTRAVPSGPLLPQHLVDVLPHIQGRSGYSPIRVLCAPGLDAQGRLVGLQAQFDAASVVMGRVVDSTELRQTLHRAPERYAWVHQASPTLPAALCLPLGQRASRVQVLITRAPKGLVAFVPKTPGWEVLAASMEGADRPTRVGPMGKSLGMAGELLLKSPATEDSMQIFVFSGALAWAEYAQVAEGRLQHKRAPKTELQGPKSGSKQRAPSPGDRWVLDEIETQALLRLLTEYPGGRFTSWTRHHFASAGRDPALKRLQRYLVTAPNMGDYCGRLLQFQGNEAAIAQLQASLEHRPEHLALLPSRVRQALGAPPH